MHTEFLCFPFVKLRRTGWDGCASNAYSEALLLLERNRCRGSAIHVLGPEMLADYRVKRFASRYEDHVHA